MGSVDGSRTFAGVTPLDVSVVADTGAGAGSSGVRKLTQAADARHVTAAAALRIILS
jgi:hypothetical protein